VLTRAARLFKDGGVTFGNGSGRRNEAAHRWVTLGHVSRPRHQLGKLLVLLARLEDRLHSRHELSLRVNQSHSSIGELCDIGVASKHFLCGDERVENTMAKSSIRRWLVLPDALCGNVGKKQSTTVNQGREPKSASADARRLSLWQFRRVPWALIRALREDVDCVRCPRSKL
jgi:hypothetical protein